MTPGIRVIRFARAEPASDSSGAVTVSHVLLDEQPAPAGSLMRQGSAWSYVLSDGTPSGLTSVVSRQDLEHQVTLYHLGTLPSAQAEPAAPPLKLAM